VAAQSAQQEGGEEEYEWKTWKTRRSHAGFNGFGGFFFGAQSYTSDMLGNLASAMQIGELDQPMMGMGGWGMGHVGGGWRVGGLGYGYLAEAEGVYTDPATGEQYNRRVSLEVGGGGFILEYSPWMIGPVNLGAGAVLGWGGAQVQLQQDTGVYDWDELTQQYVGPPSEGENISTDLMQGFVMAEPYVTARVHLLDWMAFSGTAGYHFNSLQAQNWMYAERDISGNGPDIDMNNFFFRFGFVFGG
jgi:hypothetical protein